MGEFYALYMGGGTRCREEHSRVRIPITARGVVGTLGGSAGIKNRGFSSIEEIGKFIESRLTFDIKKYRSLSLIADYLLRYGYPLEVIDTDLDPKEMKPVVVRAVGDLLRRGHISTAYYYIKGFKLKNKEIKQEAIESVGVLVGRGEAKVANSVARVFKLTGEEVRPIVIETIGKLISEGWIRFALEAVETFKLSTEEIRAGVVKGISDLLSRGQVEGNSSLRIEGATEGIRAFNLTPGEVRDMIEKINSSIGKFTYGGIETDEGFNTPERVSAFIRKRLATEIKRKGYLNYVGLLLSRGVEGDLAEALDTIKKHSITLKEAKPRVIESLEDLVDNWGYSSVPKAAEAFKLTTGEVRPQVVKGIGKLLSWGYVRHASHVADEFDLTPEEIGTLKPLLFEVLTRVLGEGHVDWMSEAVKSFKLTQDEVIGIVERVNLLKQVRT